MSNTAQPQPSADRKEVVECLGIAAHEWTFGVEEGQAYVHTEPCGDTCWFKHGMGDERQWLYMEPMKVQVGMATDCPAYGQDSHGIATKKTPMRGYESGSHYIAHGSHCDCNWWPVVVVAGSHYDGTVRAPEQG